MSEPELLPPPDDQSQEPWRPPNIEKTPPRPAPTEAYSWRTYNPNATLHYLRDHKQVDNVLSAMPLPTALGFDLEWKPNFVKGQRENPVALIQLANADTILLIQVSAMKEFPAKLAEILANPAIVKTGVAIQSDARKLCFDYNTPICNCVDLSLLARTVDNARWQGKYNASIGLAHLIESYEYKLMPKGKITRSNWERVLNEEQLEYASNDAHAGFILYSKLSAMIPTQPPLADPVWFSFNCYQSRFYTDEGGTWTAFNPLYDPGPAPPPRPDRRKPRIPDEGIAQETLTTTEQALVVGTSSVAQDPQAPSRQRPTESNHRRSQPQQTQNREARGRRGRGNTSHHDPTVASGRPRHRPRQDHYSPPPGRDRLPPRPNHDSPLSTSPRGSRHPYRGNRGGYRGRGKVVPPDLLPHASSSRATNADRISAQHPQQST